MKKKKKFGWNQQKIGSVYAYLKDAHKQLGKEKGAIYLKFCNLQARELCAITGEIFETEIPLAFFLNDDYGLPVNPRIAFERGFIMSSMDFRKLESVVLQNIYSAADSRPKNMVSVNLSLSACMKIWMGLDELFKILEMKTEGPKTSLCELYDLKKQIQNVVFSVLRSTKECQHQPIVITEQPPVVNPAQVSEEPF